MSRCQPSAQNTNVCPCSQHQASIPGSLQLTSPLGLFPLGGTSSIPPPCSGTHSLFFWDVRGHSQGPASPPSLINGFTINGLDYHPSRHPAPYDCDLFSGTTHFVCPTLQLWLWLSQAVTSQLTHPLGSPVHLDMNTRTIKLNQLQTLGFSHQHFHLLSHSIIIL